MSRPTVTPLRGAPPAGHGSSGAPLPTPADASPEPPRPETRLLHPIPARAMAFLALAVFGALHWMQMLDPAEPRQAWWGIGAAVVVLAGLLVSRRLPRAARTAVAASSVLAGTALAILAAGADDALLSPGRWDELAGGIARGADALAGVRVPYRGLDEWVRLVIALGGTLLLVLSAALAFWPRRAQLGFAGAAIVALVTLYAVPAVALIFDGEFVRGALLALLVLAFLRLERLRRRDGPASAAVAVVTVSAGLLLAPALDGIEPWWDYETWAMTAAGARSTTFQWEHEYGPLDWPRDGRELLRVKSKSRTYWKADQLDVFDGDRWQQNDSTSTSHETLSLLTDGVEPRNYRRWVTDIQVSIRNLRSETFVTAGTPESAPVMPRRPGFQTSRPGIFSSSRTLRRGDVYRARVYVPQPSERQLRAAGGDYTAHDLGRYLDITVDPADGAGLTERDRAEIRFESFRAEPGFVFAEGVYGTPEELLDRSRLRRSWALAKQLRGGADSPFEYVEAVERFLKRDFGYSEKPPSGSGTLDGFLFETKVGYCQQFSGAMALLLRMGGVPARVATGFSPGSYDEDTKEYVVRDYDAHSWVEVWFSGLGWVPFDPTPTSAPPRSQASDLSSATAAIGDIDDIGTATFDPRRDGETIAEPRPWGLYAGGAAAAIALLLAARALVRHGRRRRPSADLEIERALRIVDGPTAGLTLSVLEDRFAASPGAAGYVRAVRAQRYAAAAVGPTPAQRRGLRRALGRGRGVTGRLRAWWALPPRRPHLR